MKYEQLLRKAFGFAKDEKIGDRACDPAELAIAGNLSDYNLPSAVVGAGYAIAILAYAVINHVTENLDDLEHDRIKAFIPRATSSKSAADLSEIIEESESSVVDRYFTVGSGSIKLSR